MATHSSVLAWRMPGTAEPGRLPSVGSHRVGHYWSDLAAAAAAAAFRDLILVTTWSYWQALFHLSRWKMSWRISCQTCSRRTAKRSCWAGCASPQGHIVRSTSSTSPPAGQMGLPLMPCSTDISEMWLFLAVQICTNLYILSVSPYLIPPKVPSHDHSLLCTCSLKT